MKIDWYNDTNYAMIISLFKDIYVTLCSGS